MKILLTSVGTRGDMEPFLALGDLLKTHGHEVCCLFPEQFRALAEDAGLAFETLGAEFLELLNSPAGQIAMGGGAMGFKKLLAYGKLISSQQNINKDMIQRQQEVIERINPDRVVHNGKTVYPVIWSLKHPGQNTLISPVPYLHYVKGHSHVAFHSNYGEFLNKLTFKLTNFGLVKTIMGSVKWLFDKKPFSQRQIQHALFTAPTIYTISPTLFQRPEYWPKNLTVLGYHERNKASKWKPDVALETFLAQHEKVMMVTFGSMVNSDPEGKTRIILDILKTLGIPAIINAASGGLLKPTTFDESLFHFVDRIPYDWAFPKVYAVMHHGGSGTTHMAVKYGCASLIIPHIIDQYVWNDLISELGAGPKGINVGKINPRNLKPLVKAVWEQPNYKTQAEHLAKRMHNEDLESELVLAIEKGLSALD